MWVSATSIPAQMPVIGHRVGRRQQFMFQQWYGTENSRGLLQFFIRHHQAKLVLQCQQQIQATGGSRVCRLGEVQAKEMRSRLVDTQLTQHGD